MMIAALRVAALAALTLLTTVAVGAEPTAPATIVIPPGYDSDLRYFAKDGHVVTGGPALARMADADLVVWVAGNQFFAMADVVHAFQTTHGAPSVVMVTLPPGMEFDAIRAGGFSYNGFAYPGRPDVYAVVDVGPMQQLHAAGLAERYATYMHNELVLLVAKGNPKHIAGIDDLGRADVRSSLPNPLREGIMTYYGRPVLEAHGLYAKLTGGRDCAACSPTANAYFTEVHHRETPARIVAGTSDTGIVWKTEALAAIARGDAVEYVTLPAADSLRQKVSYYVTPLSTTPSHRRLADAYAAFVASETGNAIYAKYGFVPASSQERTFRSLDQTIAQSAAVL